MKSDLIMCEFIKDYTFRNKHTEKAMNVGDMGGNLEDEIPTIFSGEHNNISQIHIVDTQYVYGVNPALPKRGTLPSARSTRQSSKYSRRVYHSVKG